jgi:hypothetical protein
MPQQPSPLPSPPSPSLSEVVRLIETVEAARKALWPTAASRPQVKTARLASRLRAALADVGGPAHDLRRAREDEQRRG